MKTKKIKVRQGFTIVELVIVIGVIGVLTAVLVPTFINLNRKAEEASNQSFVKNLNTQMAIREQEEGKNNTMFEAVEDAKDIGFDVEKLTPVNGRDLVWDSVANRFALVNSDGSTFYADGEVKGKGQQIWKIASNLNSNAKGYSIYAKSGWSGAIEHLTTGFDVGYNKGITAITYEGSPDKNAVIRGGGDQCVVTINAPQDDVSFYGFAQKLDVKDVKGESLHLYGSVNELEVTKGHVAVEDTGIVFKLNKLENTGSVTNGGYIAEKAQSVTEAVAGKAVGGDYEINSLSRLEAFRDSVNSGNDFEGKTVKLTSDISLKDGWKPIGEGTRKVAATNTDAAGITTFFAGTFNGNGKTISNLNNKGFVPTPARLAIDKGDNTYAYGLFALVKNATFTNVKFTGVDIDGSRYADADMDSVGALAGYSMGNLTVNNVSVDGKLVGKDAVSGVVGRITVGSDTVAIKDCSNKANITSGVAASGIARLYSQTSGYSVTLTGNANTGSVKSNWENGPLNAGIAVVNANLTMNATGNTNGGQAATLSDVKPGNNKLLD